VRLGHEEGMDEIIEQKVTEITERAMSKAV
jgi:hypothetical protein